MKRTEDQELELAVEILTNGLEKGNKEMLESIMDNRVSYGHSGGNTEPKNDVISAFVTGKYKFGKIEISNQSIQLFGETGIVRHELHATTADEGKAPGEVHLFIITVWQKTQGDWKLIARQAVKNPAFMK